jgi:hypothetical protein
MIEIPLKSIHNTASDRPAGYVDDVLSFAEKIEDDIVYMLEKNYVSLVAKYRIRKVSGGKSTGGVGSTLKSLLKKIGITATPNCSCNRRAAEMDKLGPQWCRDNIDAIVGWLKEEAVKRNLPFVEFAAKKLVQLAICKYEKIQNNINRSAN